MADVITKLQIRNRFRLHRSASQYKAKFTPVDTNSTQSKVKNDGRVGKTNITMCKYEMLKDGLRALVKSESAKESHAYSYRKEEKDCDTEDYVALSARNLVKQVGSGQGKFVEVSDEESDEATILGNHEDDFTLSGPNIKFKLPGKIATMLYDHQRDGLEWLWSLHCKNTGGVLADDMGLGKTMQICSFIAGLFLSNLIRRVLVVAPRTLLTHWMNELSKVGLSEETREYFAACPETRHNELQYVLEVKGVLVTAYGILLQNAEFLSGDCHYNDDGEEDEIIWDYIILDEGHLLKNLSTKRVKRLLQIPCRHRIIITGTPLQNNLKELWALFNICCPGLLRDKKEFKEKYEYVINRGNEKKAPEWEKSIGSSVAKDLRACIQPYFLRRMKSEVFVDDSALPEKNEIIVWLRLTRYQRQLYEAFLRSETVFSAGDGSALAALTELKKICNHPFLLTKGAAKDVLKGMDSIVDQKDDRVAEELAMQNIVDAAKRYHIVENHDISCKIPFILSLLGDLVPKGHNVLIFSQSRKMLNLIQKSLVSNHYKYMRMDGTTKRIDRDKIVKDFQEGRGAPIFLLTSQVGGLGLNLTNADRVILVDPAWNPSTDDQCVHRAYRIGQTKDVIVYRLMTCGTVEEIIYRKQVFKEGLFRSATEHKEQIRYFSLQDLRDIFSLPKQGFDTSRTQQQLLKEHDHQHTMEESLREHVEFLETLNIAGVSQHSLLFSKAAPLQAVEIEQETKRVHRRFDPRDIKKFLKNSIPDVRKPSEHEIREKLNACLTFLLERSLSLDCRVEERKCIQQIVELNLQLDQMRTAKT